MRATRSLQFDAVGLGALNMDYLYRVDRIVVDGETVIQESRQSPGGSAANTIYGLAKLGLKTGFVGAVGDDADGRTMVEDFEKVGVDTSQVNVKDKAHTGAVFGLTDGTGHRSLYIMPGANSRLKTRDILVSFLKRTQLLHLSSFVDDAQFQLSLQTVQNLPSNVLLSFSPGALYVKRGMDVIAPFLARTEVIFINGDELQQLTNLGPVEGAAVCQYRGCRTVVVTLGGGWQISRADHTPVTAAAYILHGKDQYFIESSAERGFSVDTTGAGDAFAAGYLYGLLTIKRPEKCWFLGNAAAQFSIRKMGARAGLPTLAELSARYRELYGAEL